MLGMHENKKMVERPKEEPKFSMKNKTDRAIFITVVSALAIAITMLVGFILVYYIFLR